MQVVSPILYGSAGSVTGPSFTFSTDPNTGLYSISADTIGITTNGTLRVSVAATTIITDGGSGATNVDGTGILQVGTSGAANLGFDANEIQARSGGSGSILNLNQDGGTVKVGATTDGGFQVGPNAGPLVTIDTGVTTSPVIRLTDTTAATLTSTGHAFQIGAYAADNIIADANDIMARNSGVASTLYLNRLGGHVEVGDTFTTNALTTVNGRLDVSRTASEHIKLEPPSGDTTSRPYVSFYAFNTVGISRRGYIGFPSIGASSDITIHSDAGPVILSANSGQVQHPTGSASLPSVTFESDPDSGMWSDGTNSIGWATNGIERMQLGTSNLNFNAGATGSASIEASTVSSSSQPVFTFVGDTSTGMTRVASGQTGFVSAGTLVGRFWSGGLLMGTTTGNPQILPNSAGTQAAPAYTFYGDLNTGWWWGGADYIECSVGNSRAIALTTNGFFAPEVYIQTQAASANVYVIDSNGKMVRATSSLRYKKDVEDLEDQYADKILEQSRPVWFRGTGSCDNPAYSHYGLIAEDVAVMDPRLADFEITPNCDCPVPEGVNPTIDLGHWHTCRIPGGVQYDRFVPILLNIIKRQKSQIESMDQRLTALERSPR